MYYIKIGYIDILNHGYSNQQMALVSGREGEVTDAEFKGGGKRVIGVRVRKKERICSFSLSPVAFSL